MKHDFYEDEFMKEITQEADEWDEIRDNVGLEFA